MCKAFDKVPHQRLLLKWEKYGITGKLLRGLEDFQTGRKQRVVIKGVASGWKGTGSGIPQGSVLGLT